MVPLNGRRIRPQRLTIHSARLCTGFPTTCVIAGISRALIELYSTRSRAATAHGARLLCRVGRSMIGKRACVPGMSRRVVVVEEAADASPL